MAESLKYNHVLDFRSAGSGFSSERDLVDYIELNLPVFCEQVARTQYRSHKREWPLGFKGFGPNLPKIDLMSMDTRGRRIGIECKYPKHSKFGELSRSVSQILSYAVIARERGNPFDELYLVTTEYDHIVDKIIQAYELPIHVVVFCKEMRGVWLSPYSEVSPSYA